MTFTFLHTEFRTNCTFHLNNFHLHIQLLYILLSVLGHDPYTAKLLSSAVAASCSVIILVFRVATTLNSCDLSVVKFMLLCLVTKEILKHHGRSNCCPFVLMLCPGMLPVTSVVCPMCCCLANLWSGCGNASSSLLEIS